MTRQDLARVDYCLASSGKLSQMIQRGAPPVDVLVELGRLSGTLNVMKAGAAKLPKRPRLRRAA